MKNITLFIIVFFFYQQSFAQETALTPQPVISPTPILIPSSTPITIPSPTPVPIVSPMPTPVTTPQSMPALEVAKPKNNNKTSVYVFLSSANNIKFDNVTAISSGSVYAGNLEFKTDSALGVGFDIYQGESNSWGWSGGLSFDSKRNINSANVTLGGASASVVYILKPTISILTGYFNAVYRWNEFYIPIGFNYSATDFTRSADATGTITVNGDIGAQFGFGFQITNKASLELINRVVSAKATGFSGINYYDYGTGYLRGLQINLKFDF